jgi:uncharacterized protein YndB with AHSA1/START domain
MDHPLPRVERTVHLGAAPPLLWQHLVNGDLASLWMGGHMTIEPRLNGRVSLLIEGAPEIFGTVEAIVAGELIIWTWRTRDGEPTQVTLRLEDRQEGTELTVSEQMIPYEIVHIPTKLG